MIILKRKRPAGAVKAVYEEMYITDCHIKAGISEYEAYEEFGHRCGTREYLKLASLLQTNLKRGTKRLRELLYQESYDAFEQRKICKSNEGRGGYNKASDTYDNDAAGCDGYHYVSGGYEFLSYLM